MLPAIVVIAYNRPKSLERLLLSISNARYPTENITLIISIDKSDSNKVENVAKEFKWKYGEKRIITLNKNVGLRDHVLRCGDLSFDYNTIIMLEDDLYVSPYYYMYAMETLTYYNNDDNIAGVSLYNQMINETANRPFNPIDDGGDIYFIQMVSSWGQAWTSKQWFDFREWYKKFSNYEAAIRLPDNINNWPKTSWKKEFVKYIVANNKYFVYPRSSLTTNFGDSGTHHKKDTFIWQVPLLLDEIKYKLVNFEDSIVKYDVFLEILPSTLKNKNIFIKDFTFEVDLYGTKNIENIVSKYLITSKPVEKPILSFGRSLKPHDANIVTNNHGDYFSLVKTIDVIKQTELSIEREEKNYEYDISFPFQKKLYIFILAYQALKKLKNRIKK